MQISEAVQRMHGRLTDVTETLDDLVSIFNQLADSYGKVWVESLMGTRLLLDAQNRGFIDKVREMTARYLEKTTQT